MTDNTWVARFKAMGPEQRHSTMARLQRDKTLALVMLAFAFFALAVACAQNFTLEPHSLWRLGPVDMFVMSVSAAICAALGAVMWLRMETHLRFLDLLTEIGR